MEAPASVITVRAVLSAPGVETDISFRVDRASSEDSFAADCGQRLDEAARTIHQGLRLAWVADTVEAIIRQAYRQKTVDVSSEFVPLYGVPPDGRVSIDYWLECDRRNRYYWGGAFPALKVALRDGLALPDEFRGFD